MSQPKKTFVTHTEVTESIKQLVWCKRILRELNITWKTQQRRSRRNNKGTAIKTQPRRINEMQMETNSRKTPIHHRNNKSDIIEDNYYDQLPIMPGFDFYTASSTAGATITSSWKWKSPTLLELFSTRESGSTPTLKAVWPPSGTFQLKNFSLESNNWIKRDNAEEKIYWEPAILAAWLE